VHVATIVDLFTLEARLSILTAWMTKPSSASSRQTSPVIIAFHGSGIGKMNRNRVTINWQFARTNARRKFGYNKNNITRPETWCKGILTTRIGHRNKNVRFRNHSGP